MSAAKLQKLTETLWSFWPVIDKPRVNKPFMENKQTKYILTSLRICEAWQLYLQDE